MEKLDKDEISRYSRHLVLKEFGAEKQIRLKQSKALVVGAGGLGCPALLYLAAAGVGQIGIIDDDNIELSNLQRQILYHTSDIGRPKAVVAAERLSNLNPNILIKPFNVRITSENAQQLIGDFDVVIDGTDNFATRYLINDCCVLMNKPLVYGSILKFEGQLSVFNVYDPSTNSFSSNYRDLFPQPPNWDSMPNCEEAGVLGVLPGLIGTLQATEAIKILSGLSLPLVDRLLIWDAYVMDQTIIKIKNKNSRKDIKSLIDYELFCGKSQDKSKSLPNHNNTSEMKEITVQELKELMDSGADFQLVDVREPHEFDICNLDGELIPMSQVPENVDKIDRKKKVVVHCRSGKRSADTILWLERNHQFDNLYNLKGGILAWSREIDPSVPTY